MKRLLLFEELRMRKTKRSILLCLAILFTGISGVLIGSIYAEQGIKSVDIFLFIVSAFNQFIFIFISYFYIISITKDFENHIYLMYEQYGISLKNVVFSKILMNIVFSFTTAFLFIVISYALLGISNSKLLYASIVEVGFAIIFAVLCSTILALLLKKTMSTFLANFVLFIVFNVGNLAFNGILSPSDVNGLAFSSLRIIANRLMQHSL